MPKTTVHLPDPTSPDHIRALCGAPLIPDVSVIAKGSSLRGNCTGCAYKATGLQPGATERVRDRQPVEVAPGPSVLERVIKTIEVGSLSYVTTINVNEWRFDPLLRLLLFSADKPDTHEWWKLEDRLNHAGADTITMLTTEALVSKRRLWAPARYVVSVTFRAADRTTVKQIGVRKSSELLMP